MIIGIPKPPMTVKQIKNVKNHHKVGLLLAGENS